MPDRKITRIEIEYDDGETRRATGDAADFIWGHYQTSSQFYLALQKRPYEGPAMEVVREAEPERFESVDERRVHRTLSELARGEIR
jgi:hypothetical protein